MFPIGTHIRTTWNDKEHGTIVGYGAICWPHSENFSGDGGVMHPVYLVQMNGVPGSNSRERACVAFRADRVEEVK